MLRPGIDVAYGFMVWYRLSTGEALRARFVVSPLSETTMSLRALNDPSRFPLQAAWVTATRSALRHVDVELLLSLSNSRNHWPDFLQPVVGRQEPTIEAELDAIRSTPPRVIDADLRTIHTNPPPRLATGDISLAVADELARYWEHCMQPHWQRIRTVLEADVVHRANRLARVGLQQTLEGLSPTIHVRDGAIEIESSHGIDTDREIPPAGITLVPTMFSNRAAFPARDGSPLVISYAARGQAHMWTKRPPVDPDAVAALLGATKATLLALLDEPRSSTELAAHLGITTSAANQHLRLMHAAGLLTANRHGRHVLYGRTAAGDALAASPAAVR